MAGRIPPPNVPIIDEHGFVSNSWYRYFVGTETSTELTSGVLTNLATDRLVGRDAAGTGAPEALSVGGGIEFTGAGGIRTTAFTGDVTKAAGSTVLYLAAGGITNGSLADMPLATFKGRDVTGAGPPQDLNADEAKAVLVTVGEALSKTDDTNVTMTLGGLPTTALLSAASMTLGWTGQLAVGRGGTGVSALGDITRTSDTNVTLTLGGTPTGAVITSTSFTLGWTGTLAITRGGTGASTAATARVNILPSLAGNTLKFLRANAGETDVEWVTQSAGVTAFTGLSDVPASYSGQALKGVFVNAGATALEFLALSTGGYQTVDVDYTDGGNSTTAETDLFSYTIPASGLGTNGDRYETQWTGTFVSSATATRQLRAYFDGVLFFDTGALTLGASASWEVECTVTRVSSTVVRTSTSMTTQNAALAAYTAYTEVTGRTLSNTNILKLTGTAAGVGAATNDIIGKVAYVEKRPFSPPGFTRPSGTSFPGSPATGDLFWRSDRNIEYVYDGAQWLSTQLFTLDIATQSNLTPITATTDWFQANPHWNEYDVYVTRGVVASFNTTVTSANFFTYQFTTRDGASTTNIGSSISGLNNTQNAFIGQSVTINTVVSSTVDAFGFLFTETGTASVFHTGTIQYRLVG